MKKAHLFIGNVCFLSLEHGIFCLTFVIKNTIHHWRKTEPCRDCMLLNDFTSYGLKYPSSRVFLSNKQYSDYKVKCWDS